MNCRCQVNTASKESIVGGEHQVSLSQREGERRRRNPDNPLHKQVRIHLNVKLLSRIECKVFYVVLFILSAESKERMFCMLFVFF